MAIKKEMDLKKHIKSVLDYPKDGVDFKDITPLFNNVDALQYTINAMSEFVKSCGANVIVAPEARGFLFGPAVAFNTKTRFVLVRKPGKLPREVHSVEYALEYGTDEQQMHKDDLNPGDKVVIIDDILATGGTMEAIIKLIEMQGATIEGISFLADLEYLHDPEFLSEYTTQRLVSYAD